VIGNAAAAAKGLQQRLNEINGQSSGKTVLDVLSDYNHGGRSGGPAAFKSYATSVFRSTSDGFGNHSALLIKPYGSLTDPEKAMVVNKMMRVEGYDAPRGAEPPHFFPPEPKFTSPPPPWQKSEDQGAPQPAAFADSEDQPMDLTVPSIAPEGQPDPRAALAQRASGLGIDHTPYLPTSALLRDVHTREADQAQPYQLDDAADRIEQEIDGIGMPLLQYPDADAPPPQGIEPLTRAGVEARADRLGVPYGPQVPSDQLLASLHSAEAAAAPAAAAPALADHIERDIDQMGALANLPGFNEEQDDD
jgi:hypothetical protein